MRINWDFCGGKAYQIYKTDGCVGEADEHLSDADPHIEFYDDEYSREFLINEEVTQYHLMPGTVRLNRGYYEVGYFTDSYKEGIDGKPEIIERCFGCGQCEAVCPVSAISFKLEYDFDTLAQKAIEAIEKVVDVSKKE